MSLGLDELTHIYIDGMFYFELIVGLLEMFKLNTNRAYVLMNLNFPGNEEQLLVY